MEVQTVKAFYIDTSFLHDSTAFCERFNELLLCRSV